LFDDFFAKRAPCSLVGFVDGTSPKFRHAVLAAGVVTRDEEGVPEIAEADLADVDPVLDHPIPRAYLLTDCKRVGVFDSRGRGSPVGRGG